MIDADVFFLRPINFIKDDKFFLSTGDEYHIPYFIHMKTLHENFEKVYNKSGICHHMLYNKKYVNEIFKLVEEKHKKPFWQIFITSVTEHKKYKNNIAESGASEYELYFNYMIKNHSDKIIIRNLKWSNVNSFIFQNINNLDYDYVSICAWMN